MAEADKKKIGKKIGVTEQAGLLPVQEPPVEKKKIGRLRIFQAKRLKRPLEAASV